MTNRLSVTRAAAISRPSPDEFRRAAETRRVIPVHRRLLVDGETAIGLYSRHAGSRPGSYLLESAEQGVWSRYSFIGVQAAAVLTEVDGHAAWTGRRPEFLPVGGDPSRPSGRPCGCCTPPGTPPCRRSRPGSWVT